MKPYVESLIWHEPSYIDPIDLGSLDIELRRTLLKDVLRKSVPKTLRDRRKVYVIKLTGPIIIKYNEKSSPTLYIGEGDAKNRLLNGHIDWLTGLMHNVRQAGLQIRIATPRRKKFENFYKCIEADLLGQFYETYGCLPFFNKQREKKYAGKYNYSDKVQKEFRNVLGVGTGNKHLWAITPLKSNPAYDTFQTGIAEDY